MIGRLRRLFARPSRLCPLTLSPANDIAVIDGVPHSTGSDPFFLLEAAPFPAGRCEFAFDAAPGTVPLQPVLYLDTGEGFSEAQSIRLGGGGAGRHRLLMDVPPDLRRLRLDPTTMPGPIPIGNARLIPRDGPAPGTDRSYAGWVRCYDTLQPDDRREIAAHIAALPQRPRIAIRIEGDDPAARARTERSLTAQLYEHWRLASPTDPGGTPLLLLQAGDVLAPHALYRWATAEAADVLTADEDRLDPATGLRSDPQFRSQPSADGVAGGDLPGAVLLRGQAASAGKMLDRAGPAEIAALVLAHLPAHHVPGVLVHRPTPTPSTPVSAEPPCPDPAPLVSVVIPTRDRATLLRRTVEGVLRRTSYSALELLILDNGSTEVETRALYAEWAADARVRVLPAPGPFNYAALNNVGVEAARGEVVVLLNNDMDVLHPDWLAALVAYAVRPEVGAVGCKLLYEDGTVQHAGVVTGLAGLAGHPLRGLPGDAPGPRDMLRRTREVGAVTGACLAMRRALYLEMGGMDAAALAVSYNDVDLCLRLRQAGYRVIWTPTARLLHLESVSRGLDASPENAARAQAEHDTLLRRWGTGLLQDPFFNPQLDLLDEGWRPAWPPRATRPWRDHADR